MIQLDSVGYSCKWSKNIQRIRYMSEQVLGWLSLHAVVAVHELVYLAAH